MIHLGILGSTRGSNLLPILEAISQEQLQAKVNVVISNKADAIILARAAQNHIAHYFVDPKSLSREDFDEKVSQLLVQHQIHLVVLIGYMRILSADFIKTWRNKIINVHPSLLPAFAGKMDLDVHRAVLQTKVAETGCTVHYVTEEVDAGPIILQKKCLVHADDTPERLKQRVQQLEAHALIEAISMSKYYDNTHSS